MDNLVLFSFTFSVLMCFVNTQDPRVASKLGDIIGKSRNLTFDVSRFPIVHEYLGIPFAHPPVGDRRFRKPEPITSLDSPFYAQNHRAICPQFSNIGQGTTSEQSEDCLFLNVYVPDQSPELPYGHAVMIWVYGGGFQEGAANFYDGAVMSASGNVIVVTFNYRVGVFGFLSTGDGSAPGNFGLWDQRLAFQWVHDNIEDFGGDKNRVTIAGQSAGAMSVIQHALVPDNKGLFQRVLAQSGTMSMPGFDFERDGMKDVLVLADHLGCQADELMNCLREKSVDEYMTALTNIKMMDVNFIPIMDGELMKVNPQHISKISKTRNLKEVEFFRSLDFLTGFNSYDGASILPFIMDPTQIDTIEPTRDNFNDIYLPNLLKMLFPNGLREELMKLVEAQYTNWADLYGYQSIRLHITKLAGDINFAIPAIDIARLHKNLYSYPSNKTFMYHFTPAPSVRTLPTPSWIPGANHGDELPFMFGRSDVIGVGEENAWEVELSARMVGYWSNFIKTGSPNFPNLMSPFYWSEYDDYADRYILLEKNMTRESTLKRFLFAEEANFWLNVFPELAEAVEGTGSGRWCGDISAAAENLNIPKTLVLVIMTLFSVHLF